LTATSLTRRRIKELIVERLNLEGITPEMIGDDDPLLGEGLGLDSVDALELVVVLEKEYAFRIDSEQIEPDAFSTVARLAELVESLRTGSAG
jgi:acyl carrier protein